MILLLPAHAGSNVAESPIAFHPKSMSGGQYAVPSWELDYEQLGVDWPGLALQQAQARVEAAAAGTPPRVPAADRRYAMWLVTHSNHTTAGTLKVTQNTFADTDLSDWKIPELGVYVGPTPWSSCRRRSLPAP